MKLSAEQRTLNEKTLSAAMEHLRAVLPMENLSDDEAASDVLAEFGANSLDEIARGLFRQRKGQVIVTGDRGVGKTTLLRRLAAEAGRGRFPFLAGRRFLRFDVSNVGPEDSRACLEAIIAGVAPLENLVLCLDGFAALFPRANGGTNKPLIRTLLQREGLKVIGTMTDWEYAEHVGGDAQMSPLVTRVRLEEPREEEARAIVRSAAKQLAEKFNIMISEAMSDRAVALSSTFLVNERHPAKGIHVLWHACETARYHASKENVSLAETDLVRAVAELTDLPVEAISGTGAACDFETALRQAVVGQDDAVQEVATELRLIAAGLTEPDKPASVMMFAGPTGVGKTELAKRIAELYSSSRRLHVYSMGNFTEPHSVSGLVGVPPGYVGHEQGGRLINDLNADPYAVFLLDEAEKCHPNVWKPFLNLFDEGWIVDQRGVKAYADRAIFILTTNAGDREIAQLTKSGKPRAEIAEHVRKSLARVRQERSSQVVFPPQFLSRIKRIIPFQPLDESALAGIAERIGRRVQRLWRRKQGKELAFSSDAIKTIARQAHELNDRSGGQEGGRIVRKLFSDRIERRIQDFAADASSAFRAADSVQVTVAPHDPDDFQIGVAG